MSSRRLERLTVHKQLAELRSGQDHIDAWLHRHALASQQTDSARTFVLVEEGRVIGSVTDA